MKNKIVFFSVLLLIASIAAVSALLLGSSGLDIKTSVNAAFNIGTPQDIIIVKDIRLPRIIIAFLIGGMLGVSGAALQALLRNPLTDPFITGVSSGSALGAAIGMILGGASVFISASIGAIVTVFAVHALSLDNGRLNAGRLLLGGVIIGSMLSSLTMALSAFFDRDLLKVVLFLMGDISGADSANVPVLLITSFVLISVLMLFANDMNIISGGEETALVSGVNVELVKTVVFISCSLLTAVSVAAAGVIGFAGLIVPHAVRRFTGADMRAVIPASFLAGGIFILLCDTAARMLMRGYELPAGVVSGLLGAPVFLFLIFKRGIK